MSRTAEEIARGPEGVRKRSFLPHRGGRRQEVGPTRYALRGTGRNPVAWRRWLDYLADLGRILGPAWADPGGAACRWPEMGEPCLVLTCPLNLVGHVDRLGRIVIYRRIPVDELPATCAHEVICAAGRDCATLDEIAAAGGTTRQNVQQAERIGLRKLAACWPRLGG